MALSATFTANFSSFYDAVAKADKKLIDFGAGADKAGKRLDTMTDRFSGVRVVQEAALMTQAIEDIGGVSNLTAKELEYVGAKAQEAVEKMGKMGIDVPKDIQEIADKTKDVNEETSDWVGTLTKVGAAVGIAFSVDAIRSFIGSVFAAASEVKDLSDQWGVSTETVQRWVGAAKESGVTAQSVGKSVQFLSEKLGGGTQAYKDLLANVGLSYEKLNAMSLDDAYMEVVKAISGIKDESLQLDIANGLIGDSAKKMVGAYRDGFVEAAAAQEIMSKETIASLARAEAAWAKLANSVVIHTGTMLAAVGKTVEGMTSNWGNFFGYMALALRDLGRTQAAEAFLQAREHAETFGKSLQTTTTHIKGVTAPTAAMNGLLRTTVQVLETADDRERRLKKSQQDRADALKDAAREQEQYNESIRDHKNAVDALAADFAGDDLIAKATMYQMALDKSIPIQQMTRAEQDKINKVMNDAIGVYEAAGQTAPESIWKIAIATEKTTPVVQRMVDTMTKLRDSLPKGLLDIPMPKLGTLDAKPKAGMFDGFAKNLMGDLSKSIMSAIQGGGNMFAAAGSTIGSYLLDPKLSGVGKAIGNAASKLPGLLGGAISSAIPVVGSFIGPAIGWLSNKIAGWFGKKEHEKLRESFIQSAGGVEVLRTAAENAGISLDRLFAAKKTEGVKTAIAEIEESLKFQADAYGVAIETAERYGFTLEQLGPAMAKQELDKQAQALFKDWEVLNSAGLDTVAITEKMAGGVNDYVQHALKMGTDIPEAMRPMLESFAKSGLLLDENGGQITDLEGHGLSFTMSMSEGFKELIGQVKLLTDAIARGLGLAIKNTPDLELEANIKPKWYHGGAEPEGYAGGTNGFKNFGTGTPVVLHGWEAVVPRDDAASFATVAASSGGGAPSGAPQIIINAQGAFFDTPGDLQRLAARVEEALSARHGLTTRRRAA